MPGVRAVIYARQSQDRSGAELGVTRQRDACAHLCAQRGWDLAEIITDNDTSVSSRRPRPGFQQVLRMVDKREVDIVVVYHVDRLVRKIVDLEDVIERCERAGVRVATDSGDIDLSTDSGRLVGRILASVARGEVERKSARQRLANDQAAAAGRRVGGRRPFGYERDGLTLIPGEADAVRAAYTRILSGGSLTGVAQDWNARGLHSGQAAWKGERRAQPTRWSNRTVGRVLLNPRYAGLRWHRGEIVAQAEWPAIVPEETWRAVETILKHPSRLHRPHTRRRLLTNLAQCGVCGELVHGGGASHGKPIYRCKTGKHINRLSDPIDAYVETAVLARLSQPDAMELLVDDTRPDVATLREQAQVARTRLDSVGAEFAEGELTTSQLRIITTRLRAKLADIEARMADAGRTDMLAPLVHADDVAAAWERLGEEQGMDWQRQVIASLFEIRILPVGTGCRGFDPDTVEINDLPPR